MKNLNSAFLAALTAETRTVIRCAKIERRDGEVFGLTELDQDLVIDGVTYRSLHGLSPTAIASDLSFQSNNVELTGLISNNGISLTDIRLGFFDYAKIQVFLVNYLDLPTTLSGNSPKFLLLPVRVMGKVSYSDGQFTVEVMGVTRFRDAKIPRATATNCRYKFGVNQGYSKCAVNVDNFASNLNVTDERTELSFFTSWGGDDDRFTGGTVTLGSVGRYADFTRTFLPRRDEDRQRWVGVKNAMGSGEGLPPIEVYKVGEVYFVVDGNHRVSIARQEGFHSIDARVIEFNTEIKLTPDIQPDDLIAKAEYVDFLSQTRLMESRPNVDLSVTTCCQYDKLLEEIHICQYVLQEEQKQDVAVQDAAANWYDTIYIPLAETIRDRGLLRWFPGRTITDLYIWIAENRARPRERAGLIFLRKNKLS